MATQLTAGMGLRGFRLNLAIEGASGYDDLLALLPKIQAAVGQLLAPGGLEKYKANAAAIVNRAVFEIPDILAKIGNFTS